jgi:aspartyl-tRNA(Asn)/glutamyl-tRNA(Gln) amidotransferase subunit A
MRPVPSIDFDLCAEQAIADIARLDPHLRAFAGFEPEWLRERAWTMARTAVPSGPLKGLKLAIKDLLDLRGLPTGGGSRHPYVDDAPADAVAVEKLAAAGMLPLGKTHTVELAFGTWGINRATATPRNPWDAAVERVPGGSSSGSAVAVAAGLADAALGTDTGGSIRIPAALNGIAGLKPTQGRISRRGCLPLCPDLDTVGPMARQVEYLAWMLGAMAGPDPADPPTLTEPQGPKPGPFDATRALATPMHGKRLGVLADHALDHVANHVGEAYLAACSALESVGARLVEVRPPLPLPAAVEPSGLLMAGTAWRHWHRRLDHYESEMDMGVAGRLKAGQDVSDTELIALRNSRRADQQRFHAWLEDIDGLLTPTVPLTAPALADVDEAKLPFSHFVRAANWLDLPAVAVPCGFDRGALPMSLQVLGLPWRDASVLGIAAAYQRVTDWHERRPDLAALVAAIKVREGESGAA